MIIQFCFVRYDVYSYFQWQFIKSKVLVSKVLKNAVRYLLIVLDFCGPMPLLQNIAAASKSIFYQSIQG